MNWTEQGKSPGLEAVQGMTVLLISPSLTHGLSLKVSRLLPEHLLHSILSTEQLPCLLLLLLWLACNPILLQGISLSFLGHFSFFTNKLFIKVKYICKPLHNFSACSSMIFPKVNTLALRVPR